ncbi:HAD-IA family hydrolase [Phytoactinopolyspora alkaliphila]|uniref:HAD-IA family hydrolase n=1 Tax=Phytoactinopolyspora alkaliphila TaxID=1783498 RepID=A0A6N9YPN3_9ACTN|nr:HAD-IA family hydrolase [Phytoactinopolyspora alkaliphila]NED96779.1 HAD-IA family hydrolase [Phytoactinopolyspora alkaliphila]
MAVRVLMVDVDGVLVHRPDGRPWHADLATDLGIDPALLQAAFFRVHFDEVVTGRAELFDRLDAVLPQLGNVSSRELVDYWFRQDAILDYQLLTDLAEARARGLELHLATVQEHHRARYLWETLGLVDHFAAMHYAADVGALKSEAAFYRVVESRTRLQPAEHCLIDDSAQNVEVARSQGWQAFWWKPASRLADALTELGIKPR